MLMSKVAPWSEGGGCHVRLHRASLRGSDSYEQLFKIPPCQGTRVLLPYPFRHFPHVLRTVAAGAEGRRGTVARSGLRDSHVWAEPVAGSVVCPSSGNCL